MKCDVLDNKEASVQKWKQVGVVSFRASAGCEVGYMGIQLASPGLNTILTGSAPRSMVLLVMMQIDVRVTL